MRLKLFTLVLSSKFCIQSLTESFNSSFSFTGLIIFLIVQVEFSLIKIKLCFFLLVLFIETEADDLTDSGSHQFVLIGIEINHPNHLLRFLGYSEVGWEKLFSKLQEYLEPFYRAILISLQELIHLQPGFTIGMPPHHSP